MPITPDQARRELARRELARRELARREEGRTTSTTISSSRFPSQTRFQPQRNPFLDALITSTAQINPLLGPTLAARQLATLPEQTIRPTMALGGGVAGSGLPFGASLGAGLGAAVAELELGRRQALAGQGVPPDILQRAGYGGAGTAALTLGTAGVVKHARGIGQFFKGNPKKIAAATQAVNTQAHQAVKSMRPGGKLHTRVFETIQRESENAWAPMKQVANAIDGEIPLEEVRQVVAGRIQDPGRLQAAMAVLDEIKQSQQAFTAPQLVDLSSEIGGVMKKGVVKGMTARNFNDMVYADLRSAIGDILEMRAPQTMKGFVAQAKQQWADYATDRDLLFRYFAPFGSQNLPTTRGASLLKRAAQGNVTPSEAEFLGRVQQVSGMDLPASIRPFAIALRKAKQQGKLGTGLRKVLPYATGVGYLGSVLTKD